MVFSIMCYRYLSAILTSLILPPVTASPLTDGRGRSCRRRSQRLRRKEEKVEKAEKKASAARHEHMVDISSVR